jgi:hypothetical protein
MNVRMSFDNGQSFDELWQFSPGAIRTYELDPGGSDIGPHSTVIEINRPVYAPPHSGPFAGETLGRGVAIHRVAQGCPGEPGVRYAFEFDPNSP